MMVAGASRRSRSPRPGPQVARTWCDAFNMFFLQKHGAPKSNGLSSVLTKPLDEKLHIFPLCRRGHLENPIEIIGSQALLRPSGGYREVPRSSSCHFVDHWYPLGAETSQVPCFFAMMIMMFDNWNFGVSKQFMLSGNVSPEAYSWTVSAISEVKAVRFHVDT